MENKEDKRMFTPRVPRKYIGRYIPRGDGYIKASGIAKYSEDITLKRQYPDLVYMKILKSRYPNAIIKSIDTSKAEALPGVVGIIKYSDPEVTCLKMTSASYTDGTATMDSKRGFSNYHLDRKVLEDHARWVGDEIGVAVAAETIETAEEALKLIDVEWEVLPFVIEIEDALKPDAPILHPEMDPNSNYLRHGGFFGPELVADRGNVDKAFDEADIVLETQCKCNNPQQCSLDYWNCLVDWRRDQLVVVSDSYEADQTRMHFHDMFGVPLKDIRVISPLEGGQFGRSDTGEQPFYIISALMSKKTGRPVKYRHTRKETFHDTRTKMLGKVKIGAMKDGTVTAIHFDNLADKGAYADVGFGGIKFVPLEWSEITTGQIPNLRLTANAVYTNKLPSSCMRSIGNIHMNFYFGLAMDTLAEKLNMDPVELAIKNVSCHNVPAPNPCVEQVIRRAAEEIGWNRRHAPGKGEWFEGTKKRGLGFSVNNTWHTENHEYRRGATDVMIKLNSDGTVILDAPTVETGTGSSTCAMLACAETLGVKVEDIRWISVQDTETGLKDQVQTDSAVSYILAECVHLCALDVKSKLLKKVARKLGKDPEDLDIKEGRIFVKAFPEIGMTIKEYYDSVDIVEEDSIIPITSLYTRPLSANDYGSAYMATFVEVEVDTSTGQVEVLKMVVASDGGTIIFPPGAEGQMLGGQVQGLGESLYEEMIYDEATGVPLNFNFIDYKFPTMADWPDDSTPIPMEVFKGRGEFGASGIGEAAPCCTPRAVENAIYNAIGVRINELPITPMKVLEALGKDGE